MEILSLGEKIKKRRKELDLTLKNLAGDRITAGQISLIESGKSNPSMDLLEYLASALKVSVEHLMETEETQAGKICIYYQNIAESNILNNNLEVAWKALEDSFLYIEKYDLELNMATNLYLKALILEKKKEYDEAQELLLSANNIYIKYNCSDEIIKVFMLLGKITLELNAYHSAYSYFQQAEKVFEESDVYNEVAIGKVYYYISKTLNKMGIDKEAIEYMKYAEEKLLKLKDSRNYGESFMKIGQERFKEGNLNQAIAYTEKSLSLFKTRQQNVLVAYLMSGLGELFSEYGYIDRSFEHLLDAKAIKERISEESTVNTLMLICNNYIKLKDEINAKKVLEQIVFSMQNLSVTDCTLMCKYHILKYKIELLEKKYEEAERTLIDALNYTEKMNYHKESAEIAITLGKFYMDLGKEEEARKYLDEGVKILEQTKCLTDF
ncbi:helix-turn-helix transcriptional regulator [uncultured Clostridium sp.]|uniref:helix-turn-helix domain-containing protein n=1 Tax=uncultured Clostridium sp. TaxID=59620 RepID=UPI003218022E